MELEDLGLHRLLVPPPTGNIANMRQAMEQIAERIAAVATT